LAPVDPLFAGAIKLGFTYAALPPMRHQTGFSDMKALFATAAGTAGLVLTLLAIPALAEYTVTEREKQACQVDYHNYCGEYGLGTEALRACMSRNIKKISHMCVGALVEAGHMTKAQADKLRAGKKPTSKAKTTSKKKPTYKKTTTKKTTTKKVTSKSTKKKN
jgi:hypothetical protein